MKTKIVVSGLLLATCTVAYTQVASHAPTTVTKPVTPQPAADAATLNKPVARVNGAVLTQLDLTREEYTIFPYAKQHGGGLPKDLAPQIRTGAMQMIEFEELVYQEALRRKMVVPAARLQRSEADFRKQFANPEEFNALLQSEFHGSQQQLQEKVRRSLLIDQLLKQEVESRSATTPAEVRAYFDKNPARFRHPETYTFQTISFLPPQNPVADAAKGARQRAEKALPQTKAAKSSTAFGLLAEKISDDDYRVVMGQHKPVPADQLAPQVLQAFHSMKLGDISDVIVMDQACTIIHLQEHAPAGTVKFETVQADLTKELKEAKRNQLRKSLDAKLRVGAKIEEM